jgi:hypothetical protein
MDATYIPVPQTNEYIYIYKTGGSVYVGQVMSLTGFGCADESSGVECDGGSCACASEGCGGEELAPSITRFLPRYVPIYIHLGK